MYRVYCHSKCTTCKRALAWLDSRGIAVEVVDIRAENPDAGTLREAWHMSGLPLRRFFNTSGQAYREGALSKKLPAMTEDEQLALLASDGMLVRRPLLIGDGVVLVGFREEEWENTIQ